MTTFLLLACVGATIVIVWRVYANLKNVRHKARYDMDAAMIQRLRARGADPFRPYQIDFFFALPNAESVRVVNEHLELRGFVVNVKATPDVPSLPFSLYATKSLRLSVPDMHALSTSFTELAVSNGGRYDGWAVAE
jgi:hypothetical protein